MDSKISRRTAMVGTAAAIGTIAVAGEAVAKQSHMEAAIVNLQKAKEQLQAAAANKGGHRTKAIGLIDQAISEVRQGIRFANS
ncbi:hypothetical protein L1787_09185 [Acuticoccus sp. M5D2P5]|uniref:hypothetical protein n=1 Tax=Acuticoccus kalidii TaxID=2910977 RepID=UPI001F159180|nr:hypothetical protein [Acuticoccus kalidii]MCF3933583.1 hypothetical protein [Acuticoccus kalidii]